MRVFPTRMAEVKVLEPRLLLDERGYLFEAYSRRRYQEAGIPCAFVQINQSFSRQGVIRGLHYQLERPQAKIIRVLQGRIFDVVVDVRSGSPTFGHWVSVTLSAESRQQLFVPAGFAHGYGALEDVEVIYQLSRHYDPHDEHGIVYDDPGLGIDWPLDAPVLSARDARLPRLADLPARLLPHHEGQGSVI